MYNTFLLAQCSVPTNGNFQCPNGSATSLIGDTCTFSCNAGYELQGSNNGTCLANQNWSAGIPICALKCSVPLNGQVDCRGNNCTFLCDPGYILQGSVINGTCENNGSWSGGQPSCVSLKCTNRSEMLTEGVVVIQSSSCGLAYQSQCTVSCDEGFTGDNVTYLCNVTSDPTMVDWVPIDGVDVMCERGSYVVMKDLTVECDYILNTNPPLKTILLSQ